MMVSVLFPLVLASASTLQFTEPEARDPRVRVWLNSDGEYQRGDRARAYVRTTEDGYLVVLHADVQGRVRVLFPLDPGEDNYARGGESFEIRSRGDRDAFLIEDRSGNGYVLAAWSPDPFRFDALAWNGHWDYRVIAPEGVRDDRETGLVNVVQQMTSNQFFEYDAMPYIVGNVGYSGGGGNTSFSISVGTYRPWCYLCSGVRFGWQSGFHVSVGFGSVGYDPWYYDPWYYDTYAWDPWYRYGQPWYYRPVYIRPVIYRPVYRSWWWDPYWSRGPHQRIGIDYRYAGCWSDPWCRRPSKQYTRFAFGTGWATGWADDGRTGRIGGDDPRRGGVSRSGYASGYGEPPNRQAQPRLTTTTNNVVPESRQIERRAAGQAGAAVPESRAIGRTPQGLRALRDDEPERSQPPQRNATLRSTPQREEPTEPLRTRPRTAVERDNEPPARRAERETITEPPARSAEPQRTRVLPNVERDPAPNRATRTEPSRQRVIPNAEREPAPNRATRTEPSRQRVIPNIEREPEPNRATRTEPSRQRVNPNIEREPVRRSEPERRSVSEPPNRSVQEPPSRAVPRRSVQGYEAPQRSAPERSAPVRSTPQRSAPERSAPVRSTPQRSAPERSAPVRSMPQRSNLSERMSAQPRSSSASANISRSSGGSPSRSVGRASSTVQRSSPSGGTARGTARGSARNR